MATLAAIIILYLAISVFGYWLEFLNLRHLREKGGAPPPGFEGHIDRGVLERSREYTIEHTRFSIAESLAGVALTLVFILLILKPFDGWVASFGLGFIASGILFFMPLLFAEGVLGAPWALYRTFRIEKKYGFSNMTPGLWIADFIKSMAVSATMTLALIAAGLWIVRESPVLWWFWIWCLFTAFSVFMMYVSPYVIEPLFNKFEEVEDPELKKRIIRVAEDAGIRVGRVLKIDASRRTSHTNAYFTGIGHVKRIVLYDTLLEKLDNEEIASVLAHEAGHWRKKHLQKALLAMGLISLLFLYLSYRVIESGMLGRVFAFEGASFYALVGLLGFLAPIVSFPMKPLFSYFSRRHEREADAYALELSQDPAAMAGALVKLSKDNLSNLFPHPLYAAFYYSHPPMAERVGELMKKTLG